MEPLVISPTPTTPAVCFNPLNGKFELRGRSTPEHPGEFYHKLNQWIDGYKKTPQSHTEVTFYLEYFNTSSSKYILEMLKNLVAITHSENQLRIVWFYEDEDEDMRDAGMDFSELLKIQFEIVSQQPL